MKLALQYHHFSIKTADIFKAIAFYEALGFGIETRFTAGITLACWMRGANTRLELMQVPEPQATPNGFEEESYVGFYHLSFEVENLEIYLQELVSKIGKVKVLLTPRVQEIGDRIYRVAFIADPDGLPIELISEFYRTHLRSPPTAVSLLQHPISDFADISP